jgi:hypothetical protein
MENYKIPDSSLLRQLENLASLSEDTGSAEIKPFKSWKSSKYWSNAIFKMRLCNAGEVIEIASYGDQFSITAKDYITKLDTVIRSVFKINDNGLGDPEEVSKYNKNNSTSLNRIEYLRIWANNLEQVVVETLYTNYVALQMKQLRLVMNQCACEVCGQIYEKGKLPEGTKTVLYSTGEIVCGNCIGLINPEDFDFKEENKVQITKPEETDQEQNNDVTEKKSYICVCKQEFDELEEFVQHRTGCEKANK